ncbi:helix-turn-helix transcriptional regulator [Mesorhizobium sp. KR9-304]|uniref:helix-turn-helix transcriptional regulator n=1 Tax=Mesorhizobium sp. KR9-304 TaxID=3156614 RepID=UPI0032B5FDA3
MALSAAQCREARALLNWTKERLALESESAPKTVHRFEANTRAPQFATLQRIKQTLAGAGVEFIAENGGTGGVRLRK